MRSCSKTAISCRGYARSASPTSIGWFAFTTGWSARCATSAYGIEEQHQFLARVLRESPGGILVLDFDRRIELINPAAARLLQTRGADILGAAFASIDRPLVAQLDALTAGESRVVTIWGGRRVRAAHGTFVDRGFRRSFYLLEELTEELRQSEKAAYEKLIRMLSHEVNNTVGASNSLLNSCLSYASQLATDDRADFERAIAVVIGRTAQLNEFMRSFADVVRLRAPARREVDLAALVSDVASLARGQGDRSASPWPRASDATPVTISARSTSRRAGARSRTTSAKLRMNAFNCAVRPMTTADAPARSRRGRRTRAARRS